MIDGCSGVPDGLASYIWIANSGEGTLSKIDTKTAVEVSRYWTCAYADPRCDPSRTSVNLHGDAVVTNRGFGEIIYPDVPLAPSSVTKFAADHIDCVDRNGNGTIDTSTGPTDVKEWGADECTLWSTELPDATRFAPSHGARATAWDGQADEETGAGGSVWVGTCALTSSTNLQGESVYRLDGDTGIVVGQVDLPEAHCAYGGAVDADGNFWLLDQGDGESITRIDAASYTTQTFSASCAYGITVDSQGRVWTSGRGNVACVARFDPSTEIEDVVEVPWTFSSDPQASEEHPSLFPRGIAIGVGRSQGSVWFAETYGDLFQLDEETMEVVAAYPIGPGIDLIGVAVDYQGYVWSVAQGAMKAYKLDPQSGDFLSVPLGWMPYTYSDMTGVQLRNAIVP